MKRLKLKRKSERWVSNNRVLLGASKKDPGRNPNFDTEETKLLISLWGDPALQRTLITTHRKHTVIAKLAEKMGEYGYTRSAEEINTRIKNLKCFYNRLKKDMESGVINSATWRHFGAMDEIMTRSIFSVRPNEIPKPSLRYRLEVEKAEQEEKDRVEAALTRAAKATIANAQVSDENILTSSGAESSAEEVLEENCDARMNCDENAIMDNIESGDNHVKIKEEECSDSVSRDIEDASLLIPKEEPLDDDTDVQIITSEPTKTKETPMPRIQDFIQISNNALSSQCRPLVNGILSNNTLQASASPLTPGITQSIVFANQPNTMQTGNKISLVPTNFLLQQNPKQTQQIQIRQQPQQRIICSQANTQPGNGIVTSTGAGMKVLLVNRFQNGKPTNGVVTKETSFTNSNLITTSSIHKTNMTEVPLLSKKPTAEPAKSVRTEDAASTKDPASCIIPRLDYGRFVLNSSNADETIALLSNTEIASNESVIVECESGYNVQGPSYLHCWAGKWSVKNFPQCLPAPCVLPYTDSVSYEGGYRAGFTIAHASEITAHCNSRTNKSILVKCNRGTILPNVFNCSNRLKKSPEMYPSKAKTEANGEKFHHVMDGFSKNVTKRKDNGTEAHTPGMKSCGPPNKIEGALVYKNSDHVEEEEGYPNGTEIYFNCIASVSSERNTWKIICENGEWIGRSYSCANGTCLFHNNEKNVVSFYNDLEIREDTVEFPPGATIISRCADIGKYAMVGSSERTCIHSEWTTTQPTCYGLNQENDYAMEKPPTILFRHQNGPIAQSNDGKLIVYPGTTLHMECLWMRRFGNPKWNVSNTHRTYPEGWVTDADEGRDSSLEYRLSIINAVERDSGSFTCQTPARHEHTIEVLVRVITCPVIPVRRGLIISVNDTKLGSRVNLSCANGNSLIGTSELVCLPSGNWSAPLPVCESIECGDINMQLDNQSSPRVAVLSREVGGRASFSCSSGYGLRGPMESICLPTGEWALPFPTCIEVQCDDPGAPENGYAQGSAPYRAGDVVQLNCNPEFMMQGQPIIACQDSGRWSGGLPKCVQACSYPGTVISGRMSSVKFYYTIGESITFSCDVGLELRGATMVKCLKNGKWSNAIPTCISTEIVNNSGMLYKNN